MKAGDESMDALEEKFANMINLERDAVFCRKCGGHMIFKGGGTYVCHDCKNVYVNKYGRLKDYIREHGVKDIRTLSRETGIRVGEILQFIHDGKINAL